jgi:hypothetical protein
MHMKRFTVILLLSKYESLRTIAKKEGLNVNEIVRRLIDRYLDEKKER